ncbi:MAG: phosphatidylserine decarboxylase [Bacteroidales bacterium]
MRIKKRFIVLAVFILLVGLAFYPSPENPPINYVERPSGEIKTEKVAGENWLVWLYNNPIGELSLHTLVKRKLVSSWYGNKMDSPISVDKISPFVEDYNVDLSIAQKQEFSSFNDFFIRKLKPETRPINNDSNVVASPADGKILAYENINKQDFIVKGYKFNVSEFLQNEELAKKYEHGSLMLFRLCPVDYHRFHFPVSGTISDVTAIDGDYYSVNPIAIKKIVEVFCENKREYVTISTLEIGDVIMAEVGATMVGSIIQTYHGDIAVKGQEKGYFKFGGSSIVLLFEKGRIYIDDDLLINTENGLETSILMGERIGVGALGI